MKKLVRDCIPLIIEQSGRVPVYYKAEQPELGNLLKDKLIEEVNEFIESESLEELADISEVLKALIAFHGFDTSDIEKVRLAKKERNGAFEKGFVLTSVNEANK